MEEIMQNLRQEIFIKLSSLKNLPVMPSLAFDLMSYTIDDDISVKEIANLISKDPALAAQILKVANSSFYSLNRKIGSLEKAIILLGLREIKNLTFTLSVIRLFPKKTAFCFDKIAFLRHSIITARTTEILTKYLNLNFDVSPFVAGLLHDIGKIFLDQNFHNEFNQAIEEAKKYDKNLFEIEEQIFGTDHSYIGGYIANTWNFPEELTNAIQFHHHIDKNNKDFILACILNISDLLSNLRDNWLTFPHNGIIFSNLKSLKILEKNNIINDLDIERIIFEIDDELKKSEDITNLFNDNIF
jgi:putative nucleotidyltransferase with HDIG domain